MNGINKLFLSPTNESFLGIICYLKIKIPFAPSHSLHMRFAFLFLFLSLTVNIAHSQEHTKNSRSSNYKISNFIRQTALPKWVQSLAEIPTTKSDEPVVTKLSETQINLGIVNSTLTNTAIQINDSNALSAIGQFGIPYFADYQKLILHRVAILRDGKMIDHTATVNAKQLQNEAALSNNMYLGITTVQFLLEDVRVGDTLSLIYTIEGENPIFGKRYSSLISWDTMQAIELRRLTIYHPTSRPLLWKSYSDFNKNELQAKIERIGEIEKIQFEEHNVQALELELGTPNGYLANRVLQFTEFYDWKDVARWAVGLFPKQTKNPAVTTLAQQFSDRPTPLAKASAALRWVQNEIRYFSVSIGQNSHLPHPPESVIKSRFGDCKDKSYLLVSLLSELGIEAHPVLVSATFPQMPSKFNASPSEFNHAIVQIKIGADVYYVDPTKTNQTAEINLLKAAFAKGSALVIDNATVDLTTIPARNENIIEFEAEEKISIESFDKDAVFEVLLKFRGNRADEKRRQVSSLSKANLKKSMLKDFEIRYDGITWLEDPQFKDIPSENQYELRARFKLPRALITHEKNNYSIKFNVPLFENLFLISMMKDRHYPFQLTNQDIIGRYKLTINWPKSVHENAPIRADDLKNDLFKFHQEYTSLGNSFDYFSELHITPKTFDAKEFSKLDALVDQAIAIKPRHHTVSKLDILATEVSIRDRNAMVLNIDDIFEFSKENELIKEKSSLGNDEFQCNQLILKPVAGQLLNKAPAKTVLEISKRFQNEQSLRRNELCYASFLFSTGAFSQSISLFQSAKTLQDNDPRLKELAWAYFYTGDLSNTALILDRYHAGRQKNEESSFNAEDLANEIALTQRMKKAVSYEIKLQTEKFQGGPWPHPILDMQLEKISIEELLQIAEKSPEISRDILLTDAWYYIGQKYLEKQDLQNAKKAFLWVQHNGMLTSEKYRQSLLELKRMETHDQDFEDGMQAYYKGDYRTALAKWKNSAGRDNAYAQCEIGKLYFSGGIDNAISKNPAEAFRWFQLSANAGNVEALGFIAMMTQSGTGVEKNEKLAYELLQKAAFAGDQQALLAMGEYYFQAKNVKPDFSKAFEYFYRAAFQGNSRAQARLAEMYDYGLIGKNKFHLATYWATLSSIQGDPKGLIALGKLKAWSFSRDTKNALILFHQALDKGENSAYYEIGRIYEYGKDMDQSQAVDWYEKGIAKGEVNALAQLGWKYREGKGLEKNMDKAIAMITQAAENGSAFGRQQLAFMYQVGRGLQKDPKKAALYYRLAAEQGQTYAQAQLAYILTHGMGTEKNLCEAVMWYQKAADKNDLMSINNLGDMYENGQCVTKDLNKAIELYRDVANRDYYMGFVSLASLYEKGLGVSQDAYLTYVYRKLAAIRNESQRDLVEQAAKKLGEDELKKADAVVSEWKKGMPLPTH